MHRHDATVSCMATRLRQDDLQRHHVSATGCSHVPLSLIMRITPSDGAFPCCNLKGRLELSNAVLVIHAGAEVT